MARPRKYERVSMHNKYDPKWSYLNLRVEQPLRMKIEKYAKEHGMQIAEACRFIFSEAVNDVLLTSDDYAEIAKRMKVNEERNKSRE